MYAECTLNLKDLLLKFNMVRKAISKLDYNPILKNIHIEIKEGTLRMMTYNEKLQLIAFVKCDTVFNGSFCVPQFMFKVLSESYNKDDSINIKEVDGSVQVTQRNKRNSFTTIPTGNFPELTVEGYAPLNIGEFYKALQLVRVATSPKEKHRLLCRTVEINVATNRILATNYEQVAYYDGIDLQGENTFIDISVLMNDTPLNALSLCDDVEAVFGSQTGIRSKSGGIEVIIIDYNVPKILDIVNLFDKLRNMTDEDIINICTIGISRNLLIHSLSLCKVYENAAIEYSASSYTNVVVDATGITFSITIQDLSDNVEIVPLESFEGKPHEFSFKASRLLEMLEKLHDEYIVIKFHISNDGNEPLLVETSNNLFNYMQVL